MIVILFRSTAAGGDLQATALTQVFGQSLPELQGCADGSRSDCVWFGSTLVPIGKIRLLKEAGLAAGGLRTLSQADNFGIWSYRTLRADLKGTGLEAHHLIEQRFADVIGGSTQDWASIAVTDAEHQAFTNAWRRAIPYGEGTRNATREQVINAARQIYAGYPDILAALGLG